jgi:glycosyltransferase involved in cell wall biosynthesis
MKTPTREAPKSILIIGCDVVMPKILYFAPMLQENNWKYTIYTHDHSPDARTYAQSYSAELILGPPHKRSLWRLLKDIATLVTKVKHSHYHHAELFNDYHPIAIWAYFLVLRLKRIPVTVWCRGELYTWEQMILAQKIFFKLALAHCQSVIFKETYMPRLAAEKRLRLPKKIIELHNSVPRIPPYNEKPRAGHINLLFMNMFKKWRNVSFCVQVGYHLRKLGVPYRMKIVGEKPSSVSNELAEEAKKLHYEIEKHSLGSQIQVLPFTNETNGFLRDAHIFLLPANLIFCNYSLIEAMAHGAIPLVLDQDADFARIISHGENGYGLPAAPEDWAEVIANIFNDANLMISLSRAAYETVKRHFSTDIMFSRYCDAVGIPLSKGTPERGGT